MLPQANWPDGHAAKAEKLMEYLQGLSYMRYTKLDWSTGVTIMTKVK